MKKSEKIILELKEKGLKVRPTLAKEIKNGERLLLQYPVETDSDTARIVRRIHTTIKKKKIEIHKNDRNKIKRIIIRTLKPPREKEKYQFFDSFLSISQEFFGKYFGFDPQNLPDKNSIEFKVIQKRILSTVNWWDIIQDCSLLDFKKFFNDKRSYLHICLRHFLEDEKDLGLLWRNKKECIENGLFAFGKHFEFDPDNLPPKDSKEFKKISEKINRTQKWQDLTVKLKVNGIYHFIKSDKEKTFKNHSKWIFQCLGHFIEEKDNIFRYKFTWETKEKCIKNGQTEFGKHFQFDPNNLPQKESEEFLRVQKEIYQTDNWKQLLDRFGLKSIHMVIGEHGKRGKKQFYDKYFEWLHDCLNHFIKDKEHFVGYTWETKEKCIKNGQIEFGKHFQFDPNNLPQKESAEFLRIQEEIYGVSNWKRLNKSLKIGSIVQVIGKNGKKNLRPFFENTSDWVFECLNYFLTDKDDFLKSYLKWGTKEKCIDNGRDGFGESMGLNLEEPTEEERREVILKIVQTRNWSQKTKDLGMATIGEHIIKTDEKGFFTGIREWLSAVFGVPTYFFTDFGRHIVNKKLKKNTTSQEDKRFWNSIEQIKGRLEIMFSQKLSGHPVERQERIINRMEWQTKMIFENIDLDPFDGRYSLSSLFEYAARYEFFVDMFKKEKPIISGYLKHVGQESTQEEELETKQMLEIINSLVIENIDLKDTLEEFIDGKKSISDPKVQKIIKMTRAKIGLGN